jgi:signal peptidase I
MRRSVCIVLAGLLIVVLVGCASSHSTLGVDARSSVKTKLSAQREFRVPSGSMEPTLGIGARVLVSARAPRVGEIVVFHPPEVAEQQECGPKAHVIRPGGAACAQPGIGPSTVKFVKRIVAGPDDELFIREGHVYLKAARSSAFVREPDPYIRPCASSSECNFPTPIKVSAGQWYMLGDNRGESDDSRFYGAIPTTWIVGAVTACAPLAAYRSGIDRLEGSRACRLGAEHG